MKYKLPKNYAVLVYDEKVLRQFWRIAIVTGVLSSKNSERKGAMVRIKKTNAIHKRPVNKLFLIDYTYQDTNQTDSREQKLRLEAALIGKINLLIRFSKTREIFPSVIRVLSILLITAATSASIQRVNSKERGLKVPGLIPAASYAQR